MEDLSTKPSRRRSLDSIPLYLILNLGFVITNVLLVFTAKQWLQAKDIHCPRIPHFGNAFHHSYSAYDNTESRNPLAGFNHTPELKESWANLLAPGLFRVSEDEAQAMGKLKPESVRLENGDVVMSLNIYQEIYCIKWIKLDLFNPESSLYGSETEKRLLDRCVNIIRQQRMCRLDLSVESWYWKGEDYNTPWPRTASKRLCLEWEQLEQWLSSRQVLKDGFLDERVYGPKGLVSVDEFYSSAVYI